MKYYSTNGRSEPLDFKDATLRGQPDDGGLFFPEPIPMLESSFFERCREMADTDLAFEVIRPFTEGSLDDETLHTICRETLSFPIPLKAITPQIAALELFHGPTFAFKDVGARFMSRCLGLFSARRGEQTLVIVATSGDTGGAVADGFAGVEGVQVVILYPKGKVSKIQELQLTTAGSNVITLETRGTFDDCQALAKAALADTDISSGRHVTSANSINVARWLPQQFFYFLAHKQSNYSEPPVYSVPSGNFGNISAGLLARRRGLPSGRFIAACNENATVPDFIESGSYRPRPSVQTLSNAMDVGDPSNFVRMRELYAGDDAAMRKDLVAVSISDARTKETIRSVYDEHGYLLDPHGAVGFAALKDHLEGRRAASRTCGIFLETAHPAKFDTAETILGKPSAIPAAFAELLTREKRSIEVEANLSAVKEAILSHI